jgi:hypothetical protein
MHYDHIPQQPEQDPQAQERVQRLDQMGSAIHDSLRQQKIASKPIEGMFTRIDAQDGLTIREAVDPNDRSVHYGFGVAAYLNPDGRGAQRWDWQKGDAAGTVTYRRWGSGKELLEERVTSDSQELKLLEQNVAAFVNTRPGRKHSLAATIGYMAASAIGPFRSDRRQRPGAQGSVRENPGPPKPPIPFIG